jgi:hypothetical protein
LLADKLQIPPDKAEELANRIKKTHSQTGKKPAIKTYVEKLPPPLPNTGTYRVECLTTKEFGLFMQWLFETLEYEVQSRWLTNNGVDLIVSKNKEKTAVIARNYPPNYTLTDAIVLSAKQTQTIHVCNHTIILATTCFTKQAIAQAQKCGTELWNNTDLDAKIKEAKTKIAQANQQTSFPDYQGSLLLSLLALADIKMFLIEPKTEKKYDLLLPGVKYPLLTFETCNDRIIRCVFRIKYNEPVSENDGEQLIGTDKPNNPQEPDIDAYESIIQYLSPFLE